jgi:hypothetical protein
VPASDPELQSNRIASLQIRTAPASPQHVTLQST